MDLERVKFPADDIDIYTRPPESERRGHNQHRARERGQHDDGPREVVHSGRERGISGSGNRVREGGNDGAEQQEQPSDRGAQAKRLARRGPR